MTIQIKNKYLRILVSVVSVILGGCWYYYTSLDMAYFGYPQKPDAQAGYTIPYQVKGWTVFIKPDEENLMDQLNWICTLSAGLLLALVVADGVLEGIERLSRAGRSDSQT